MTKSEITSAALMNAVRQTSAANYEAIFEGFAEKGIDQSDIEPRVNVFTFNAWLALGRQVKKGEKGVKIFTMVEKKTTDKNGDESTMRKARTTTVFHVTQTEEVAQKLQA